MNNRKLGYKKNDHSLITLKPHDGHHLLALVKASAGLPLLSNPDLTQWNGPIADQGQAGSCVAFGGGRQLALFFRAFGLTTDWVFPSPRFLYALARLQEYAGLDPESVPALADVGSMPALYLQAVQNVGFVKWEDFAYPTDPFTLNDPDAMAALVNSKVPPDVVEEAYDQKGLEYAIYQGAPSATMDWIVQCLEARMAPTFGMLVDQNYMNNAGGVIRKIDLNNVLGGHDQCIVAVNSRGNAVVAGSWGTGAGAHGFFELSPDVINNADVCSDFQIVKAAPLP